MKPPRVFVKLNIDEGFGTGLLHETIGIALRNKSESFLAAGNCRIEWCNDVLTVEALAMQYGLTLHKQLDATTL